MVKAEWKIVLKVVQSKFNPIPGRHFGDYWLTLSIIFFEPETDYQQLKYIDIQARC